MIINFNCKFKFINFKYNIFNIPQKCKINYFKILKVVLKIFKKIINIKI